MNVIQTIDSQGGFIEIFNLFGFLGTVRAVKEYDKSIGFCDQTFLNASVMIVSVEKDNKSRQRAMKTKFAVPLVSDLMYNWFRNTIRHPKYGWWIVAGSLVYLLSPFDISPDMLPIVGWIDDGLLATLVVSEVSQLVIDRFKNQKQKGDVSTVQPSV